jgi:PAS domain-containing protein
MTVLAWALAAAAVVALVVVALAARRASSRAAAAEAATRDLLGAVGDGVVRLGADGRVLDMNPAARALLDWTPERVAAAGGWEAAVDRGGEGDTRELRRPDDATVPVTLRSVAGAAGRTLVFTDRRAADAADARVADAEQRADEAIARADAAEATAADLQARLRDADARVAELDERQAGLDALEQEIEERREDAFVHEEAVRALVADAQARATSLDDREAHLGELEAAVEARAVGLDEREADLVEREAALAERAEEVQLRHDELEVTRGELDQRATELDAVEAGAQLRAAEAEVAAATDAPMPDDDEAEGNAEAGADDPVGAAAAAPAGAVPTLWAFELLRVERTWRQAMGPMATAPPTVDQDPGAELAVAVGMELDRLREDSGLSSERRGRPGTDVSPAGALLALRLVQELLAAVGPAADHLDLEMDEDAGRTAVTLRAEGWDADAADLGAIPLLRGEAERAGGGLAVTEEEGGARVVELRVAARP